MALAINTNFKSLPVIAELGSVFSRYSISSLYSYFDCLTLMGRAEISPAIVEIAVYTALFSIALTELYSVACITSWKDAKGLTCVDSTFLLSNKLNIFANIYLSSSRFFEDNLYSLLSL